MNSQTKSPLIASTGIFQCKRYRTLALFALALGVSSALSGAGRSVTVEKVGHYSPGKYDGPLDPSPPHADLNPHRAVIVRWSDFDQTFVFSHEASYCPYIELPTGAAMSNQFFEGNLGEAELMNNLGRKERNSFVDIVESTRDRVWVRWSYFAVNMHDDSQPRLRGTEDYFAYANGLILRRASYVSMIPSEVVGYSTMPVELFGIAPKGAVLADLFNRDEAHGDYLTLVAMDLFSDRRYGIYWDESGQVRRQGDDATMDRIAHSLGFALVMPFRDGYLFAILGEASGFPAANSQLIDHCTPGAKGGAGWGVGRWDHWPIGWLNSQTSYWKPGSAYPYSFGSIGHFLVPAGKEIRTFWEDYSGLCKDMDFNRWTENRVFCVLLGRAKDWESIRSIGRKWLGKGAACQQPDSVADLR